MNKLINKEHFFLCFWNYISQAIIGLHSTIGYQSYALQKANISGEKIMKSEKEEIWAVEAREVFLVEYGMRLLPVLPVPLPKGWLVMKKSLP